MAFFVAIVVGLVFGAGDQYLGSRSALGVWASTVSGMSAPWVVLPFLVGWTQERARRAMLFGLVATASALVGYFAMTYSPREGGPVDRFLPGVVAVARSGYNPLWILGGLVTGPLYGWLGHRWRIDRFRMGASLVAGALCLEPLGRVVVGILPPPDIVWGAEVALGAALAGFFVVASAARRREVASTT